MSKLLLENIAIHCNYVWERFFGTIVGLGTLGGAIYVGRIAGEGDEKPRFRDTAMFVAYGAVTGAAGSLFLLATYPIAIPAAVFVGPIHMYNKHKYESKRIKSRTDKHELK